MEWLAKLLGNVALGACYIGIAVVAVTISTAAVFFIPYLLLVIFSFIFIRPFLGSSRSLGACLVSLSKFFVWNSFKLAVVVLLMSVAGWIVMTGWQGLKELNLDTDGMFSLLNVIPLIGFSLWTLTGGAIVAALFNSCKQIFPNFWKTYKNSLIGRY